MIGESFQRERERLLFLLDNHTEKSVARILEFLHTHSSDHELVNQVTLDLLALSSEKAKDARELKRAAIRDVINSLQEQRDTDTPALLSSLEVRAAPLIEKLRASSKDAEPVVRLKNLSKGFPGTTFTLTEISLEARLRTITAIVGRNGSGKSTLFDIMAGVAAHGSGELLYPSLGESGTTLNWPRLWKKIAYVPQELPLWRGSLRENIQYEAAIRGLVGAENKEATRFIIERLGLSELIKRGWSELSGGFKLRFSLARALVWRPKLLLLDEPLANLDFEVQELFMKDLRNVTNSARHPIAVILSSQHLHEIEPYLDSVVFLEDGKMSYNGDLSALGTKATEGLFEFATQGDPNDIFSVFNDFPNNGLEYRGTHFLLKTPSNVTSAQVTGQLARFGVGIIYFRDLGRSIKSLFIS